MANTAPKSSNGQLVQKVGLYKMLNLNINGVVKNLMVPVTPVTKTIDLALSRPPVLTVSTASASVAANQLPTLQQPRPIVIQPADELPSSQASEMNRIENNVSNTGSQNCAVSRNPVIDCSAAHSPSNTDNNIKQSNLLSPYKRSTFSLKDLRCKTPGNSFLKLTPRSLPTTAKQFSPINPQFVKYPVLLSPNNQVLPKNVVGKNGNSVFEKKLARPDSSTSPSPKPPKKIQKTTKKQSNKNSFSVLAEWIEDSTSTLDFTEDDQLLYDEEDMLEPVLKSDGLDNISQGNLDQENIFRNNQDNGIVDNSLQKNDQPPTLSKERITTNVESESLNISESTKNIDRIYSDTIAKITSFTHTNSITQRKDSFKALSTEMKSKYPFIKDCVVSLNRFEDFNMSRVNSNSIKNLKLNRKRRKKSRKFLTYAKRMHNKYLNRKLIEKIPSETKEPCLFPRSINPTKNIPSLDKSVLADAKISTTDCNPTFILSDSSYQLPRSSSVSINSSTITSQNSSVSLPTHSKGIISTSTNPTNLDLIDSSPRISLLNPKPNVISPTSSAGKISPSSSKPKNSSGKYVMIQTKDGRSVLLPSSSDAPTLSSGNFIIRPIKNNSCSILKSPTIVRIGNKPTPGTPQILEKFNAQKNGIATSPEFLNNCWPIVPFRSTSLTRLNTVESTTSSTTSRPVGSNICTVSTPELNLNKSDKLGFYSSTTVVSSLSTNLSPIITSSTDLLPSTLPVSLSNSNVSVSNVVVVKPTSETRITDNSSNDGPVIDVDCQTTFVPPLSPGLKLNYPVKLEPGAKKTAKSGSSISSMDKIKRLRDKLRQQEHKLAKLRTERESTSQKRKEIDSS